MTRSQAGDIFGGKHSGQQEEEAHSPTKGTHLACSVTHCLENTGEATLMAAEGSGGPSEAEDKAAEPRGRGGRHEGPSAAGCSQFLHFPA